MHMILEGCPMKTKEITSQKCHEYGINISYPMKNNLLSTITEIKSNYYKKMSMKSQITTCLELLHFSLFFVSFG